MIGIAGAVLAGFLGQQLGWYRPGEGAGFLAAIVGAVLILLVYRMVAGRRGADEKGRPGRDGPFPRNVGRRLSAGCRAGTG